jgi:hypothetical protein
MKKNLNQKTLIIGLTVALLFVVMGVFCFSYAMETLDVKAQELGAKEQTIYEPPFPDYSILGLDSQLGSLVVGIAGTLLIFAVTFGVAKLLKKRKS